MFRLVTVFVGAALLSTACTTHPERMAGRHVTSGTYNDYSCEQIAAEHEAMKPRINELYQRLRQQNRQIVADRISYKWDSLEYRKLRGQETALRDIWKEKQCVESEPRTADEKYKDGLNRARSSG